MGNMTPKDGYNIDNLDFKCKNIFPLKAIWSDDKNDNFDVAVLLDLRFFVTVKITLLVLAVLCIAQGLMLSRLEMLRNGRCWKMLRSF